MRRSIFGVLGGVAALTLALFGHRLLFPQAQASVAREPPSHVAPNLVPKLAADGHDLRLWALESRVTSLEAKPEPPAATAAVPQEPKKGAEPPFTAEQRQALVSTRLQTMDAALFEETLDARWARPTEQMLEAALSDAYFEGTQVVGKECRATLCRVEAKHSNQAAREAFEELRHRQGMSYYFQQTEDPAGGLKTIAYFVREGHELAEDHAFRRLWGTERRSQVEDTASQPN